MSDRPAPFRDLLGDGERLVTVASATRADRPGDQQVTVGLTDRRLVTVAADSSFLDVSYAAIHSIQGRQRESVDYEGLDYRVPVALGCLVAFAALWGSLAVAADAGPGIVAFLTIGCLASLVYGRREAVDGESLHRSARGWLAATVDEDRLDRYDRRLRRHLDPDEAVVAGTVLVATGALLGLLVVTSSVVVLLFGLLAVGGVGLVDYALRRREEFDGFHVQRRQEREVVVHTADGRSIRLRLDGDSSLDRELGRLTTGASPPIGERPVEPVGG